MFSLLHTYTPPLFLSKLHLKEWSVRRDFPKTVPINNNDNCFYMFGYVFFIFDGVNYNNIYLWCRIHVLSTWSMSRYVYGIILMLHTLYDMVKNSRVKIICLKKKLNELYYLNTSIILHHLLYYTKIECKIMRVLCSYICAKLEV